MSTLDHHSLMQDLPHYREKYEAQKKINVYYIPGHDDERNMPMFFYVIASSTLHNDMMYALAQGDIPHFAVIVESGYGQPSQEIKDKIKLHYGFDHDLHANNDNNLGMDSKTAIN